MESNKENPQTLSNQTNPNSSVNMNEENLISINYNSFEKVEALNNDIGIEMFKAYWKDATTHVMLKKIQPQYLGNATLFYKLSYHRNILSIFGYTKEPNSGDYLLVTQYADGGNLRQYLKGVRQNLSWHDKIKLAIDITSGLQCLHSHDVVHLAMHPKNVFVHNKQLLIGDSGLSNTISDDSNPENIDILPYTEPNLLSNPSYQLDKKSDVYSLGFILYEISSGKAPFASDNHHYELSRKILLGVREDPVAGTPIEYIDLYEQCWDDDPTMRPSAGDVLARLGRMNLSPVLEDVDVTTTKINIDVKNNIDDVKNNIGAKDKNESESFPYDNKEIISQTSSQNHHDSIMFDFGVGVDSGFSGSGMRRVPREEERQCKLLPCFPRCRITFGAFLCCMCVILVTACFMLFFLIRLIKTKKP